MKAAVLGQRGKTWIQSKVTTQQLNVGGSFEKFGNGASVLDKALVVIGMEGRRGQA